MYPIVPGPRGHSETDLKVPAFGAASSPNVVGLVYVAAHAPDVGEDEATLGRFPKGPA